MQENPIERRSETRRIVNKFYTVELVIGDLKFTYKFKIWDISSKGISLLVREDSDLLNYLKVGDILHLKYHTTGSSKPIDYLKIAVKHITKDVTGRFRGYRVVGVSILEEKHTGKQKTVKVVCPTCNTIYRVPSIRIPKVKTAVRCRHCSGSIVIGPREA